MAVPTVPPRRGVGGRFTRRRVAWVAEVGTGARGGATEVATAARPREDGQWPTNNKHKTTRSAAPTSSVGASGRGAGATPVDSGQDTSAPLLIRPFITSTQHPTAYRIRLLVGAVGPDATDQPGIEGQEMVMYRKGASVNVDSGSADVIGDDGRKAHRGRGPLADAPGAASPPAPHGTELTRAAIPAGANLVMGISKASTTTAQRFQGQQPPPHGGLAGLGHLPSGIVEPAPAPPHQRGAAVTEDLRLAGRQPHPRGWLAAALQLPGPSTPAITNAAEPSGVAVS